MKLSKYGLMGLVVASLSALVSAAEFDKNVLFDSIREMNEAPGNATLEVGDLKPSEVPGFRMGELRITYGKKSPPVVRKIYLSDDNRHYVLDGFKDLTAKPDQQRIEQVKITESPVRGNKKAKVTVVEFVDFQCPYCNVAYRFEDKIMKDYKGKIRWVYKSFPLSFHPWAEPAAVAAECAKLQNEKKFWAFHDAIFEHQKEISSSTNSVVMIKELAKKSSLSSGSFLSCFEQRATSGTVHEDFEEGRLAGINGTPGFMVNGHLVSGADERALRQKIDEALQGKHGTY